MPLVTTAEERHLRNHRLPRLTPSCLFRPMATSPHHQCHLVAAAHPHHRHYPTTLRLYHSAILHQRRHQPWVTPATTVER